MPKTFDLRPYIGLQDFSGRSLMPAALENDGRLSIYKLDLSRDPMFRLNIGVQLIRAAISEEDGAMVAVVGTYNEQPNLIRPSAVQFLPDPSAAPDDRMGANIVNPLPDQFVFNNFVIPLIYEEIGIMGRDIEGEVDNVQRTFLIHSANITRPLNRESAPENLRGSLAGSLRYDAVEIRITFHPIREFGPMKPVICHVVLRHDYDLAP